MISKKKLQRLNTARTRELDYEPQNKKEFHSAAKAVLREIAKELGLSKDQFDVRSCLGGIGVGGEAILHTNTLYVVFLGGIHQTQFMYRKCVGREDYTGGGNHWMHYSKLHNNTDEAIRSLKWVGELNER